MEIKIIMLTFLLEVLVGNEIFRKSIFTYLNPNKKTLDFYQPENFTWFFQTF